MMSRMISSLMSLPGVWNLVQSSLGAPAFKGSEPLSLANSMPRVVCSTSAVPTAMWPMPSRRSSITGWISTRPRSPTRKRRYGDRPNMHFLAADLRTRPFPEDFFDEVLFACTVHHLDDDTFRSLPRRTPLLPQADG